MRILRRFAPYLLLAASAAIVTSLSGCRTPPAEELSTPEDQCLSDEIRQLENELTRATAGLAERDERIARLETDFEGLQDALTRALGQLGTLREDRLDLQHELDGLERELDRLRAAAGVIEVVEPVPATLETDTDSAPPEPSDDPRLERVPYIGLRNDPRAAQRLASSAPGIGVDTAQTPPVMFDTRLQLDQTGVYLSIADPEKEARLILTVQYVDRDTPFGLQAAFITTEGGDPIDPIEPIVLDSEPIRETDGTLLREALVKEADASTTSRLTAMLGSRHFLVTLVGDNGRIVYRPSVPERAAMSNMIYAFIDLGGLQ